MEKKEKLTEINRTKHSPLAKISQEWHKWANKTTLHGICKLFDTETFLFRRITWSAVLLLMFYLLCRECLTQLERYLAYKTLNKESIRYEEKLRFPAVTICNLNRIHNDSVHDERDRYILRHMYMHRSNTSVLKNYPGENYTRNVSIREMYRNNTMTAEEIFKSCSWGSTHYQNCSQILEGKFRETYFCHTVNFGGMRGAFSTTNTGSNHGLTLVLWANQEQYFISDLASAGFKVLVHDQDDEPDITQALAVGPGFSHYLAIRKHEHFYLPSPAKAFGNQVCIETGAEDFKNPLKYSEKYSFNACRQECWNEFVFERCGCIGPTDIGNQTECNPFQIIECYNDAFEMFAHEPCNCQMTCHMITYTTQLTSTYFPNTNYFEQLYGNDFTIASKPYNGTIRTDVLLVRVFFDSKIVTTHRQVLEFNRDDLFASVGGYLGLFLGASLVTLLDFIELLVTCFLKCLFRSKKTEDKVQDFK